MRVLLTTDTVGGVWTFTRELAAGLLRRGHSVALVSFGREPSASQSAQCSAFSAEYRNSFQYAASETTLEWMSVNESAYSAAEPLLLRVVREFQPDIFHSSQFCFGALAVDCPKLITAHSDVLSWAEACRPNGLEPSAWLSRYVSLIQNGLQAADAVAAPTQWMLCALQRHFPFTCRSAVIPNGRSLHPAAQGTSRKLQAVTAGRLWDEAKNVALLAGVESPFPLLIAGESSHDGAVSPEKLGAANLVGTLSEDQLLQLFVRSSVYIATSVYEPFGLAPLEAALCGCAVLANDIASLREVWGDDALYFHDAASLSALLHSLAASQEDLLHARLKSQSHAARYTADRMADQYIELYAELMGPGKTAVSEEFLAHAS